MVAESEQPGYSAIMRGISDTAKDNVHTAYDLLHCMEQRNSRAPFLGTRDDNEYKWQSVRQVCELADAIGSGLDHLYEKLGLGAGQHALGIFAKSRAEWLIAEFAGFRGRRYTVGLYDTLDLVGISDALDELECMTVPGSSDDLECMTAVPESSDDLQKTPHRSRTHMHVIVCSADKVPLLLAARVRAIISMDAVSADARRAAAALGTELLDLAGVAALGRAQPTPAQPPHPDDVCAVSFTAGTTGRMRAVAATHACVVAAARAQAATLALAHATYLAYLPLAHAMERSVVYAGMLGAMRIGFYSGDVWRVADDAQTLRPTALQGVPHLFYAAYRQMAAATLHARGLTGAVARAAIRQKKQRLHLGERHAFWDRIVCSRIAQHFGGRLSLVLAAGAVDITVLSLLRVSLSCAVVEMYGLTETCGAVVVTGSTVMGAIANSTASKDAISTGVPLPGVDLRLRSVPELGLAADAEPARGELMVRTRGGDWLRTGDFAQMTNLGVEIIDRVASASRAPGRPVAPGRLQCVYACHPLVRDIFIIRDAAALVAVVVPEPAAFLPLARRIVRCDAPVDTLAANAHVRRAMLLALRHHARRAGLRAAETIADVVCDPVPFDIEGNRLLTPMYSLRRHAAMEHYARHLTIMRPLPASPFPSK
ncbi:hypothetical protein IW148_000225 [Coemansia sp. RSA 1199]|nr:hypothetical protein IW148_000225 [Coemansia sp. RSA 1199]